MPRQSSRARAGHACGDRRSSSVAPARAEDVLARLRLVRRREPAGAEALRELGVRGEPPHRLRERLGSPGGTSSALSPSTSSSRAAGVSAVTSGVPQASAWNALFGITRRAFAECRRSPSAQPRAMQLSGQPLVLDPGHALDVGGPVAEERVELTAADDRKRSSGASRAAARIVSSPCSGISLPTKSA